MDQSSQQPYCFLLRLDAERAGRLWDVAGRWRVGRCAALRRALQEFAAAGGTWTGHHQRTRSSVDFCLAMDQEGRALLADLARRHRTTKSAVLREAINAAWTKLDERDQQP